MSHSTTTTTDISEAYSKHRGELIAYFVGRGFGYMAAEDIAQEAFVRLMSVKLDGSKSVRALVFRTAKNIAIDMHRHSRRSASFKADSMDEINQFSDQIATEDSDMLDVIADSEVSDMVLEMIEEQPESLREVVQLYYFSGMTYAEIASHTGVSLTTCKDRVQKVLGIIRERIQVAA